MDIWQILAFCAGMIVLFVGSALGSLAGRMIFDSYSMANIERRIYSLEQSFRGSTARVNDSKKAEAMAEAEGLIARKLLIEKKSPADLLKDADLLPYVHLVPDLLKKYSKIVGA